MAAEKHLLSWARIQPCLNGGAIAWSPEIHAQIDSTNNRAKALALAGAAQGTLVIADRQSAGRGRFGRKFHSPQGVGAYLSIVLRPRVDADQAAMLTPMAAVAVARAIEAVADVRASIKWVNDVYIGDKKVCGILCEAGLDAQGAQMQYVVVGVGVNVGAARFPDELKNIATSISNECGENIDRNRFIAELLNQMNLLYSDFEIGVCQGFVQESRSRSNVIGRNVLVLRGGESYPARAVDIDDHGSLIVQRVGGEVETLHSGEVSLRRQ